MDEAPPAETNESQESEQVKPQSTQESDEMVSLNVVSNGRRRGRRRVMKKRTVKDEEGFLGRYLLIIVLETAPNIQSLVVTRNEHVWESYSEEESGSTHSKTPASSAGAVKSKKGTTSKAGQGNIMSFFGKK